MQSLTELYKRVQNCSSKHKSLLEPHACRQWAQTSGGFVFRAHEVYHLLSAVEATASSQHPEFFQEDTTLLAAYFLKDLRLTKMVWHIQRVGWQPHPVRKVGLEICRLVNLRNTLCECLLSHCRGNLQCTAPLVACLISQCARKQADLHLLYACYMMLTSICEPGTSS